MQNQPAFSRLARLLSFFVLSLCLCSAAGAESPSVWVTLGDDAFDTLIKARGVLSTPLPPKAAAAHDGVVVTRLPRADLAAVSELMHAELKRCGGFIVHGSLDEAKAAMRSATRAGYKVLPSDFTVDQEPLVNSLLPLLDDANILSTIDHLSTSYVNRYYQYATGEQGALWIRDLWQGYATGRSDVTVTTYDHGSYVQPSVILTIDGATLPDEIVVLGGHLDSIKSGGMTTSTVAPGADDNASGIASLSEVIRVLMDEGWTPDRTVKFMGYAAEEVGLLGSGDIAADHQSAGADVVAVLQLDMTDFNGSAEDVALIDDYTNADLRSFAGELLDTYQPSLAWTTSTCGYACSDHASWHNRGYPAVMPFEAKLGEHNLSLHTSNDNLATLGNQALHALKFAKLALSFAIETGMAETPPPGNPQDAVYDAGLGAPACATAGSECDSTSLLDGRANIGPEPNQPNTLDSCNDGTSGSYHSDESNDRLVVSTLDGEDFAEGATVRVDATVYAWSTGTSDHLDLYYAADANSPSWTLITTIDLSSGGLQTLSAQYTLPAGALQAVRANFRYQGSASPCSGGNYDDHDDLVFAVGGGAPECDVDADCDDGAWCNGAETCDAGSCSAGSAPVCNDGAFCNGAESCNESTDSCDAGSDPCSPFGCDEGGDACLECNVDGDCDDGLFCNGAETCDAGSCSAGSAPCSGGETCNEGSDVCESGGGEQDAVYDSGLGAPACAAVGTECDSVGLLDGRASLGPEPNQPNTLDTCNDGTSGSYHSDESNDRIVVRTVGGGNLAEGATVEVEATVYAWSTGSNDTLDLYYAADATSPSWQLIGSFAPGGGGVRVITAQYTLPVGGLQAVRANFRYNGSASPCTSGSYNDHDDLVFAVGGGTPECVVDADCDDGLFCNGGEACNAGSCQAGSDPCPGQSCDEVADACVAGGCTLDDDFESGTAGWVNDPSSTCSTGDYVTGNPTNPSGGYQVVGSHSGTSSIFTGVNTSAGNADVDGGNCVLASPTWSVTPASTLSVWYWFGQRDAGDDAAGDFNILEYSINGGATWNTLASNGDSTVNPAWTEATAAIPAGSDVRLRVQCSDGSATGDLIECGIDDVSICDN